MPYKDPEKAKEAKRKSAVKRREKEKEAQKEAPEAAAEEQAEAVAAGMGDRLTVEDAEAVYGDSVKEAVAAAKICKFYGKSHTWACVMYKDSAPSDWEDKLRMIGVAFAVSPLHDADKREDGKLKKEHWHVILHWPGGTTTYRTAAGISRGVLCGTIPIPLVSPRGYYRYFCHLDNPTKARYDEKDIVVGNGFDIGDFLELTAKEKAEIRNKLLEMVIRENISEYWDLVIYGLYNCNAAEQDYICSNTLFWQGVLRSKWHIEHPVGPIRG